ncbi:heme exporter protein CcmB [Candidatus Rariloculus sp.]|uniref:heme exporter protein CcmB n=1 Tax=Candidatus Rariloculus sp. TaxID=3101265 RepID=UPI003D0A3512
MDVYLTIMTRDLKLAFRRWSEFANPLLFFVIVTSLFPLALAPEQALLQTVGAGVLWVAALLSSLLALEGLFRGDVEDGSMEQILLSSAPFGVVVLAKITAHWIVTGIPLIVLVPVIAMSFQLPADALATLAAALLLATPTLSILSAIGAALTVSLKSGGSIIGLLVLPLCSPMLIFGTRATDMAANGEAVAGPLYLLAALAVFAVSLGPLAVVAALRVGLE